jgi:catechol 2,3-dioxygenase-like lactoylglutathione lyase family enzyme
MKGYIINGIQQMGVGVKDLREAWSWYIMAFGMDCRIFEEEAEARIMLPYTGGEPRSRHAVLAFNLQSGGGFEVWQYKGREPRYREKETLAGDIGIFSCKMKVKNIDDAFRYFTSSGVKVLGEPIADPAGKKNFFISDPFGNIFQIVEATDWFMNLKKISGGAYGAIIGVTDIDAAMKTYSDILGYDKVIYDTTGSFGDFAAVPGGKNSFRRVLLARSKPFGGGFSPLLGQSVIELIKSEDRVPTKIYEGRYWGDPGFIHLCYDITGMDNMRNYCEASGSPFTVDSQASHKGEIFDMGEAAGHFAYIEDYDGTLIEFVETHKVPILKKLGWYLDLSKRDPNKPLPGWMIRTLKYSRVKKSSIH